MSRLLKRGSYAFSVVLLLLVLLTVLPAIAQEKQERTLDEIKAEAIHRAENGV
jgi:outer membrane lipoprotein-sorting protein